MENLKKGMIVKSKVRKIAENVYARKVYLTEEYIKSLPPMPQSIIDNSISLEEFISKHPYPDDKM